MLRSDEKFAMILLDLPGRVLPMPKGSSNLDLADLMQLVGKARQLTQGEVDIPEAGAAPTTGGEYIVLMRRRRR